MRLGGGMMRRGGHTGVAAVTGFVLACLAPWTSVAMGAPPVNDYFADRETLSGSLPIEVSRSNVEATKEPDEDLESSYAAGHSVWFKWQATDAGWTTIGSCQGAIVPVVAIFEGTGLGSLTKVARSNLFGTSNEGPHCNVEREFTFKANAGTTYSIAVDGNTNLTINPPATEGEFKLRIESRPPPANDDFEDAMPLTGEIFGEPGPNRFYRAEKSGYTWGATKQPGEPNHGGNQGGASVWYAWTAPETGMATVSTCCGPGSQLFGVYAGDYFANLTLVGGDAGFAFPVIAGMTYWIAVDGLFQPGEGTAEMESFVIRASMYLPTESLFDPPPIPEPDTEGPHTTIVKHKLMPAARKVVFRFRSSESGGRFRCKLDGRRFTACKSPRTYKNLNAGRHTFAVMAVDAAGNADATPALSKFQIPPRQP